MAKKLDLAPLNGLFAKGKDFELTDFEYEEKIGKPLPGDTDYIKSRSPLAKKAKEHGFTIAAVMNQPVVQRTVIFKKIKSK